MPDWFGRKNKEAPLHGARIEDYVLHPIRALTNELVTRDDGIRRPSLRRQVEMPLIVGEEERAIVCAVVEQQPELVVIEVRR